VAAKEGAPALVEGSQVLTVEPDGPVVGAVDAADEIEHRALAAAALAHDGDELTAGEGCVGLAQHNSDAAAFLVALGEVLKADKGWFVYPLLALFGSDASGGKLLCNQ
jgi:hypothetical protein